MKIIYYSPHPHLNLMSPSGFGTHMREMITAFRKEGCEVLPVIMGGEDTPPAERLNQNTTGPKEILKKLINKKIWRTLKDFRLLKYDKGAAERLDKTIEAFNPDFIYERCNYLQLSGIRIAQKHNIRHALELNSPYVDEINYLAKSRSYIEKYAKNIEKKQIEGTDLALAVVGPLRDFFCEKYAINPDKFLITHNAFNADNIRLNSENQKRIVQAYQLSDKIVIGYVGSIFEWHGLDKLIKALHKLDMPDIKLLIVGYGAYMVKLIELVEHLNMEEKVIFVGRVPKEEVFDYIHIMDICVAPDAGWYQSPVKIFEYGAMGKPILGPNSKAVQELMEPDEDGILVNSSVTGIKNGLHKLLMNRKEGRQMGKNFQQKVLNNYTWQKNAESVLERISKLEA